MFTISISHLKRSSLLHWGPAKAILSLYNTNIGVLGFFVVVYQHTLLTFIKAPLINSLPDLCLSTSVYRTGQKYPRIFGFTGAHSNLLTVFFCLVTSCKAVCQNRFFLDLYPCTTTFCTLNKGNLSLQFSAFIFFINVIIKY